VLPRFDSPAIFARLLDDHAGHWSIRPTGPAEITRRYVEGTLVLETTFRTPDGTIVLVDGLALGRRERGHGIGASSPGVLLREATCVEGTGTLAVTYAPRPEFGLVRPLMEPMRGGLIARGGAHILTLSVPADLRTDGATAHATVTLTAGQRFGLALHAGATASAAARRLR
jgi:hypothetical protein